MKWYSASILIALIAAVVADQKTYTDKWDNLDVTPIFRNSRLFLNYKECILGKRVTGCPQEAVELKRVIPEALSTRCAKCSDKQKDKMKDILEKICAEQPESFKEFLDRFDPTGEHRVAYEDKFGKLKGNC
ncbi:ejaculatory bulb-specific protein 3-like [Athalia rosae]|uniref:ejaculatory bulb-specific protein 3-like n=1 Tax=Athalia rosae TaxID=37344 RepID=UPI000626079B|nr:ejaculatory bulb-specific protein 3-like [Athalia rosae]